MVRLKNNEFVNIKTVHIWAMQVCLLMSTAELLILYLGGSVMVFILIQDCRKEYILYV